MKKRRRLRIEIVLVSLLSLGLTSVVWANEALKIVQLGDCPLDSGEQIVDCQLGYRTAGTLNEDRSNVIVFPTWFTGNTSNLLDYGYVGPGKIADTNRFYIIAIESFGNGISSSPSNSLEQVGVAFPQFSIRDMVSAQHRLLTDHLDIGHVHAVIGASMGGMQAFEWAVSYPGFMDYVVPIEGTPWQSAYDLMLWNAQVDAIDTAAGDEATVQKAIMLLTALDGLTLWSPSYFNQMVERDKFESFMQGFSSGITPDSLLDRRSQTVAMLQHDISQPYEDFDTRAAGLIKAKTLIVVFDSDHMVNPGPSLQLAELISAQTLIVETTCGHMGANPDCDQAQVATAVNAFINPVMTGVFKATAEQQGAQQ